MNVRELQKSWGLISGASGKEPICQCRRHKRHRFDPWVGKIPWRRAQQPTPVFFPGESHGKRSLVGYSPSCYKESDTTEVTYQTRLKQHLHSPPSFSRIGNFLKLLPFMLMFCFKPRGEVSRKLSQAGLSARMYSSHIVFF